MSSLDKYLAAGGTKQEPVSNIVVDPKQSLVFKPRTPSEVRNCYLTSVEYDGDKRLAFVKLYNPETHTIHFWYDDTDHKPYCLSDQSIEALKQNEALVNHPGFDHFLRTTKHDGLNDREVEMTVIAAKDPLSIGGRPSGSIREMLRVWEADIKYVENYIYDRDLKPGMPYNVRKGKLLPTPVGTSKEACNSISLFFKDEPQDYQQLALEWIGLLECPVPEIRKAALDIEVYSPVATRIPDPELAEHPVICASVLGSDGARRVLLLKRQAISEGALQKLGDIKLEYYESEERLLIEIFKVLLDYPLVLTFNGDDFDLRYLWHRAQRLGFRRDQIPIEMARDSAQLRYGIHIDLYKFFFNRSVQVYAFGQKYRENTLQEVGSALIGHRLH